MPGTGSTAVFEKTKFCPHGLYILVKETDYVSKNLNSNRNLFDTLLFPRDLESRVILSDPELMGVCVS